MNIPCTTLVFAALAAAVMALARPALAADPQAEMAAARPLMYRITDLGEGWAQSIDSRSQVLVQAQIPAPECGAAVNRLWSASAVLPVSGDCWDAVFEANERGQVAGSRQSRATLDRAAVTWRKPANTATPLPLVPGATGSNLNLATGVNKTGAMVGVVNGDSHQEVSVAYWSTQGVLTDLGPLSTLANGATSFQYDGGEFTLPRLNDNQQVVANAGNRALLLNPLAFTGEVLDCPPPVTPFALQACGGMNIGPDNTVVGYAFQDSSCTNAYEAAVWVPGQGILRLGSPGPQCSVSAARGVNRARTVVGYYTQSDNLPRAFVWSAKRGLQDLNMLVDPADPLAGQVTLHAAYSINDRGEIVGYMKGNFPSNLPHAFLLTPVR